MKLLVCDIEGTIFKPHMIKSSQHASYIWTAIAEKLGKDAEREEIYTQQKWRNNGYGPKNSGRSYIRWVNDTIAIHKRYGLTQDIFEQIIEDAQYVYGVEKFFESLNREKYIPIFISGGIQNLSKKACRDLGVEEDNSFASCKYYFDKQGQIDEELTFNNTSNFYGKQELVQLALRKYGLGKNDWIFIGDGINDVSVASIAPLSIGIDPVEELRIVTNYSFLNFCQFIDCHELIKNEQLFATNKFSNDLKITETYEKFESKGCIDKIKSAAKQKTDKQVHNLNLPEIERHAWKRIKKALDNNSVEKLRSKFFGIVPLLEAGEYSFSLLADFAGEEQIASAILQPFCNATEIMIYVCYALTGRKEDFEKLGCDMSLKDCLRELGNENLCSIMYEYRLTRNIAAHAYKSIPVSVAKSFIQRTYENIQRMELIVNPF